MNDINRRIAAGATWMVGLRLTVRLIGLVSTVILARLLVPSDFGLIAMATSLQAAVELLSAFSFQTALIQNQQAPRSHYDSAWSLTLLLAGLVGLILVLLAAPAAEFYGEPRLQSVMYLIAFGSLLGGMQNVGIVAFQKDLEFHREFVFQLARKLSGFVVGISLAWYWRDYRALIAGMLADRLAGVVFSYLLHPFRPRPSLAAWKELLHFSKWLLLNNVIYVIRHRIADFTIGKLAGAGQLGAFSVSYEVSNLATTELAAPINRALLPGLARVSGSLRTFREAYFHTVGMIVLITLPAALGLSATASSVILVMLGTKWIDAVPVVQILPIAASVSVLTSSIGAVCIALGRPRLLTVVSGIYILFLVPLLFALTSRFGVVGAAFSFLCAALMSLPVQLFVGLRVLEARPGEYFSVVWRPIVSAFVMHLVLTTIVGPSFASTSLASHAVQLIVSVLIGACCYASVIVGLWWAAGTPSGAETEVMNWLRRRGRSEPHLDE